MLLQQLPELTKKHNRVPRACAHESLYEPSLDPGPGCGKLSNESLILDIYPRLATSAATVTTPRGFIRARKVVYASNG